MVALDEQKPYLFRDEMSRLIAIGYRTLSVDSPCPARFVVAALWCERRDDFFGTAESARRGSHFWFQAVTLKAETRRLTGAAVSKYAAIDGERWTRRFFLNWAITC
jgi:hypothetical protein